MILLPWLFDLDQSTHFYHLGFLPLRVIYGLNLPFSSVGTSLNQPIFFFDLWQIASNNIHKQIALRKFTGLLKGRFPCELFKLLWEDLIIPMSFDSFQFFLSLWKLCILCYVYCGLRFLYIFWHLVAQYRSRSTNRYSIERLKCAQVCVYEVLILRGFYEIPRPRRLYKFTHTYTYFRLFSKITENASQTASTEEAFQSP